MNILITGATGLIGKQLGIALVKKGHTILGLTRDVPKALLQAPYPAQWIEGSLNTGTEGQGLPDFSQYNIDGVIHLAGENIGAKSWDDKQKTRIKESRRQGTKNLLLALQSQKKLSFFIGASAIGYYDKSAGDEFVDERTPPGYNFLSEVTSQWEAASESLDPHVRRVILRLGVVLTTEGGALPRMLFPAQVFASSSLGSGQQWVSWVHYTDVVNAFVCAVENENLKGVYNVTAPTPVRQKELAYEIAEKLGAIHGPPVPRFVLKTLLGEQAALVLDSQRVSSEKLLKAGFHFQFTHLAWALKDLLKDWDRGRSVKIYRQFFPLPRARVFDFFADSKNLEKITPPLLNFHITNQNQTEMGQGAVIDHSLKIRGLPIKWTTLISKWDPPLEFTDQQTKGPYQQWEHTHRFEDLGQGTLMTDRIIYKIPFGLLGRMTTQTFIDKDIDQIFDFRRENVGALL